MKQYKVGDKVRVAKRIGNDGDYPFGYVDEMVRKFEGKIVTISKVKPNWCYTNDKKFYNDDPTAYELEEDIMKYDWHSSMFEPVEECSYKVGDEIKIGTQYLGHITESSRGKWYIYFDIRDNDLSHSTICDNLHTQVNGFFKLAARYGAREHADSTCFPCFLTITDLMSFVKELNVCIKEKTPKNSSTTNSLKNGDSVWIGKIKGTIDSAGSRYFVIFKADHCKTCTKLHELIPNFDSLAIACGTNSESFPIDCFPTFPTLEKLLQFIAVINNKLNNPQKLQKNENRFQKPKASVIGGSVPEGRKISGRKDKTAISSGHLSYRVCDF